MAGLHQSSSPQHASGVFWLRDGGVEADAVQIWPVARLLIEPPWAVGTHRRHGSRRPARVLELPSELPLCLGVRSAPGLGHEHDAGIAGEAPRSRRGTRRGGFAVDGLGQRR